MGGCWWGSPQGAAACRILQSCGFDSRSDHAPLSITYCRMYKYYVSGRVSGCVPSRYQISSADTWYLTWDGGTIFRPRPLILCLLIALPIPCSIADMCCTLCIPLVCTCTLSVRYAPSPLWYSIQTIAICNLSLLTEVLLLWQSTDYHTFVKFPNHNENLLEAHFFSNKRIFLKVSSQIVFVQTPLSS